jgi:hypothetical protein
MSESGLWLGLPLPLPLPLQSWITLNIEFRVLLCIRSECQHAVGLYAISSHLHRKHYANIQIRKQVKEYIQ